MKHFFLGGGGGHGSGPPYEIAPEERGRHSPSTPLVMKVTSIVYNPPLSGIPGSAPGESKNIAKARKPNHVFRSRVGLSTILTHRKW